MLIVKDWNGSIVSRHRSLAAAVSAADRLTDRAGSCIPAIVVDEAGETVCRSCGATDCDRMHFCDEEE